jgi:hypothetical protein
VPFAVRSALSQVGASFELFIVGDGVEEDTRAALEPYLSDSRVLFFDRPKGERHGALLRHEALRESTGDIVCYLCDDDLLLPWYLETISELLAGADVAQDLPVNVWPSGELRYYGFNLGRPEFVEQMAAGTGGGGLTRTAHTRTFCESLPYGWQPAPPGTPSDMYMFRQLATMPGFRGATSNRLATLNFPSPVRGAMSVAERVAELEHRERRIGDPQFPKELEALTFAAARRAAEKTQADVAPPRGGARTRPAHALVAGKTGVCRDQTNASAERQTARRSLSERSTLAARMRSAATARTGDFELATGTELVGGESVNTELAAGWPW